MNKVELYIEDESDIFNETYTNEDFVFALI